MVDRVAGFDPVAESTAVSMGGCIVSATAGRSPPPSWNAHPELVSESNVSQPMESHGSATVVAMGIYSATLASADQVSTRTEHFTSARTVERDLGIPPSAQRFPVVC